MFCKKCGKEIKEEVKYCNFCGTAVNSTETEYKTTNFYEKMINFFAPLGKEKLRLISVILLLIFNPILALTPNMKISENLTGSRIYSETYSVLSFLLELAEELSFVKVLIFIGISAIIAAEFLMLLPLIKKSQYLPKYLVLTKIISVIAILFVGFIFISTFISVLQDTTNSVVFSITFGGWLLILECVALIITTFKFSSIIKKKNKTNKELSE